MYSYVRKRQRMCMNIYDIANTLISVTRFWKTDQVVTNSISSNNDFKY